MHLKTVLYGVVIGSAYVYLINLSVHVLKRCYPSASSARVGLGAASAAFLVLFSTALVVKVVGGFAPLDEGCMGSLVFGIFIGVVMYLAGNASAQSSR